MLILDLSTVVEKWYLYIPPITSIYFVIIAPVAKTFLENLVKDKTDSAVLVAVASDWATRLNLINAMISSLISSLLIFRRSESYALGMTFATFFALAVVFSGMLWWVIGLPAGHLAIIRTQPRWITLRRMIPYGTVVRGIMILVNVILMCATLMSQVVP